ncbi:hypothetical protein [Phenylobacterium sp.]|uniref:hypothetical protein n=1 Tax=Phenylobacterium sp. TaxID=1871053 RepID=UPI0025ED2D79|nr:hypothetical protein [Phenylobacterium sp.]
MLATVLAAALALAAQPAPPEDDGPLTTAPRERAVSEDPLPGLDEKRVEIPPAAKPMDEKKVAPAAAAAAKSVEIEPRTLVQGDTLQVVLGQRAVFHLGEQGAPILDRVETGKLAEAHPDGEVTESFEPPAEGQFAVALDGSVEKRASVLKIWNATGKALDYAVIALIPRKGHITPEPAPVCAVSAQSLRTEIWPRPVLAVGLMRFKPVDVARPCSQK